MTSVEKRRRSATQRWAVVSMLASAACWGLATVMSKSALEVLPPISLLTAQLGSSIVFLWVVALVKGYRPDRARETHLAALSGVLEPGLAYALGISGLRFTSASNASLIGTTEPVMVIALAFLVLKVRTSGRQLAAILLAMAGVGLVGLSEAGKGTDAGTVGDAMIVAATLFAALYVVITSRLVVAISPLLLAVVQQTVGFVFALGLLVGAFWLGLERIEAWPSVRGWVLVVSSGVVQYALAFWLYLVALRVLRVSTAALFLALIPVFGVGGAVVFLGESLGVTQAVGSVLIIVAVLASSRQLDSKPA